MVNMHLNRIRKLASSFILKTNQNTEGISLYKTIEKRIRDGKKLDEQRFIELLKEVPLYYLLAFLGQVYYRRNQWKQIFNGPPV